MKRILLLLLPLVFSIQFVNGQCTPVQFGGPRLFLPDTNDGLKPVIATHLYEEVVSIRVPGDTIIPPLTVPVTVDSAGIIGMVGLPTGLSYVTNSPSDYWHGGTFGCVKLQGVVSEADTGKYTITVQGIVSILGVSSAFDYNYTLYVIDSINYGFSNEIGASFKLEQNIPNPVTNTAKIKFYSPINSAYLFEVLDMLGNVVYSRNINARNGVNSIQFIRKDQPAGIYFYRISNSEYSAVRRMILN